MEAALCTLRQTTHTTARTHKKGARMKRIRPPYKIIFFSKFCLHTKKGKQRGKDSSRPCSQLGVERRINAKLRFGEVEEGRKSAA